MTTTENNSTENLMKNRTDLESEPDLTGLKNMKGTCETQDSDAGQDGPEKDGLLPRDPSPTGITLGSKESSAHYDLHT